MSSCAGRTVEELHPQDETRVFALHGPGIYRAVVNQTTNHGAVPAGPSSVTRAQWTVTNSR